MSTTRQRLGTNMAPLLALITYAVWGMALVWVLIFIPKVVHAVNLINSGGAGCRS